MIKQHMKAVGDLMDSIDELQALTKHLPEERTKYKLEALLEMMSNTADLYAEQSLDIYDKFLDFAIRVGI